MIESLLRIVRAVVYVSGYLCIIGNVYAEDSAASRAMQEVFRSYHETYLTLFPIEATNFGDNRYNDRLMIDITPDFLAKERQFYRSTLEKIVAVDHIKV
jgi:type II secretory pathway predicted ATPase ExeA